MYIAGGGRSKYCKMQTRRLVAVYLVLGLFALGRASRPREKRLPQGALQPDSITSTDGTVSNTPSSRSVGRRRITPLQDDGDDEPDTEYVGENGNDVGKSSTDDSSDNYYKHTTKASTDDINVDKQRQSDSNEGFANKPSSHSTTHSSLADIKDTDDATELKFSSPRVSGSSKALASNSGTKKRVNSNSDEKQLGRNPAQGKKLSSVEIEEEKVKAATLKLVKWLRNRLRTRLREVADLEGEMGTAIHAVENLAEAHKNMSQARKDEIKHKLESSKVLADFRRQTVEPEDQLRIVKSQTKKLEKQLDGLGKTYNDLAKLHTNLQIRLRQAGFSHWLDARGKRYMPETAVGVLAKSAEILDPVMTSIGKAVEIDQELARELDEIVPKPHSALVVNFVSDTLILVPTIPILAVICRLCYSMNLLTAHHHVFILSAAFAVQAMSCFVLSLFFAEEAVHYFQRTNEPMMLAIMFLTSALYSAFIFVQVLIALTRHSRRSVTHCLLSTAIGYFFYLTAFRPSVLNDAVSFPVLMHAINSVTFTYIMTEKNEHLQVAIPFQTEIRAAFQQSHAWIAETIGAMEAALVGDVQSGERVGSPVDTACEDDEYDIDKLVDSRIWRGQESCKGATARTGDIICSSERRPEQRITVLADDESLAMDESRSTSCSTRPRIRPPSGTRRQAYTRPYRRVDA
jgi:predicted flap endonuclease-1-like 5' DNA nuclease/uncharacterized membrane protein YidH (DUF202 family)